MKPSRAIFVIISLAAITGCGNRAVVSWLAGDGGFSPQIDGLPGDGGLPGRDLDEGPKKDLPGDTRANTPDSDSCFISWVCDQDSLGNEYCQSSEGGSLPSASDNWTCDLISDGLDCQVVPTMLRWSCWGNIPRGAPPPNRCGWACELVYSADSSDHYRCLKEDGPEDRLPGGVNYSICLADNCKKNTFPDNCYLCQKSTAIGGTRCQRMTGGGPPGMPEPDGACAPGQVAWCEHPAYASWGKVKCTEEGTWATKQSGWQKTLDCQDGGFPLRPRTVCACYNFYFNALCCERPDCIVTDDEDPQEAVCSTEAGPLCAPCDPYPFVNTCSEPGAACISMDGYEYFCSRSCLSKNCPAGFSCLDFQSSSGTVRQCIPDDMSCYL